MFSGFAARRSMGVALLVITGSVAACGGAAVASTATPAQSKAPSAPVAVTVPCEMFDAAASQTRDVHVSAGQRIVVTVCSNASTGFSWQAAAVPAAVVRLVEQAADAPSTAAGAEPVIGAAGTETLTFEAVAPGSGVVGLEYSQPWDGGTKAAWRLTLNVVAS